MGLPLPGDLVQGLWCEVEPLPIQAGERPRETSRFDQVVEMPGVNGDMDSIGPVGARHEDAEERPVVTEKAAA